MTLKDIEKAHKTYAGNMIDLIHSAALDTSITKISLISIIDGIIDSEITEARRYCALGDAMGAEQKSMVINLGKIIAAEMILLHEMHSVKSLRKRALEFLELASSTVRSSYDFTGKAIDTFSRPFSALGYNWKCVQDAVSLDIISYQLCARSKMSEKKFSGDFICKGKGCIAIHDDKLSIFPVPATAQCVTAFTTSGGRIEVFSRSMRDEKLKASECNNASALATFAHSFSAVQNEPQRQANTDSDVTVKPGAIVTIRCIEKKTIVDKDEESYETMICDVLGTRERVRGYIAREELVKGVWTDDICPYFYEEDCIENAVVLEDGYETVFSIKDAYCSFCKEKAMMDSRKNLVFRAKVTAVREEYERVNWITAGGYGAISYRDGTEKVGDVRVMQMMNIQGSASRGYYINIGSPKYGYESAVPDFDEESVLLDFVTPVEDAIKRLEIPQETGKDTIEENETVRILSRIIARSLSADKSIEMLKRLYCAQFAARVIDDEEDAARAFSRASFLKNCIAYAQEGVSGSPNREASYTGEESRILTALAIGGNPSNLSGIAQLISGGDYGSKSWRIAALLMAQGLSGIFCDELKADPDSIRKKICWILCVADEFREHAAAAGTKRGKYGSVEGTNLEFKASYVWRNDSKTPVPDLMFQGRGQVFEAVCGMLNCEGGTVFIGVNDKTGDPIIAEDYGIRADMKWLCENYDNIDRDRFRQLGHHVPVPDDVDHYALFLNSEKELYFKKNLLDLIHIEPTADRDAIRITVSPSMYEIAVLYEDGTHTKGQSFVRNGNSTKWMDRIAKERRLMDLKNVNKQMNFILTLQEAIDKKHKLILRDYASGNSGMVKDRFVVPVNLFYNDENVYCWDLEEKEFKQFRLARIGNIENVEDNEFPHAFEPREADVFRWIGDDTYHVKAEMTVGARNYLLEEYSNAINLPESELYEVEKDRWILDTHLHGIGALRRFWFGLADKMTILPTEDSEKIESEFRKYARDHFAKYFKD